MAKGSKFIHVHSTTINNLRLTPGSDLIELMPKTGAELAFMIPKAVFGPMIVLISLNVKSHTDLR